MGWRFSFFVVGLCLAACAHPQADPDGAAAAPAAAETVTSALPPASPGAASKRVPLPYMWQRGGVEIRAVSIEFQADPNAVEARDRVLVSLAVAEQRNRAVTLTCERLLQARAGDAPLRFEGCHAGPPSPLAAEFVLSPGERNNMVLIYERRGAAGPIELQFPTGKWWRSE